MTGPGRGTYPLLSVLGVRWRDIAGVLDTLGRRGETVATAESLTAGAVCAALTEIPGASAVVRGGLVVYATELKAVLAGVDRDVLERHGPVHPDVASALSDGARVRCAADWGLGLTGVAGPQPQHGVPAGTVYVAVSWQRGADVRRLRVTGDRQAVRAASVGAVVELLAEHLGAFSAGR